MSAPRQITFVAAGSLARGIGAAVYDRHVADGLRARGFDLRVVEIGGRLPQADDEARAAARCCIDALPQGGIVIVDHTALPAFATADLDIPPPWIALVHHPVSIETGIRPEEATELAAIERALLPLASAIVVPSLRTGRDLGELGIDPSRATVIRPGTEPAPIAPGSTPEGGLHLLCVASLIPRKGHAVLIEALARLRHLRWELTCVGSLGQDPHTVAHVRLLIDQHGLAERCRLIDERPLEDMGELYAAADLVVLASYHEGYGMVLGESLARGMPVVATQAGAIPEVVPRDAGILVPPGDAEALAMALREVMTDDGLYRRLRAGAEAAREWLPSWEDAVAAFADLLDRV